ncbi:hypothetical protein [Enterococcus lactis]|uniref:hypothetical protein n=1 Tax=Enterococcus lactis TaxID=357441 RepID=UPI004042FB28
MKHKKTLAIAMLFSSMLSITNPVIAQAKQTPSLPANYQNDKELTEAQKRVDALFTDKTYTQLASGVTEDQILEVSNEVFSYPELQNLVRKAEDLWRQKRIEDVSATASKELTEAQKRVDALFTDKTYTQLASGVTEDQILEVSNEVFSYPELQNLVRKAEDLWRQKRIEDVSATASKELTEAQKRVDALFTDKTYTQLASGVTEDQILEVSNEVFGYPELQNLVRKAEDLWEKQHPNVDSPFEKTKKEVEALFTDNSHTQLVQGITVDQLIELWHSVNQFSDQNLKNLVQKAMHLWEDKHPM